MASFSEALKQAGSTDAFKFQEGDNKLRIVSGSEYLETLFVNEQTKEERISKKFVTWVLDRKDKALKLAYLPYAVAKSIAAYEADPEYAFKGYPMPFDINVTAEKAGTKDVKYNVIPGRSNTPLTADEQKAIAALEPIEDVGHRLREDEKKKQQARFESSLAPVQVEEAFEKAEDAPFPDNEMPA
jgi:hypothetical protein